MAGKSESDQLKREHLAASRALLTYLLEPARQSDLSRNELMRLARDYVEAVKALRDAGGDIELSGNSYEILFTSE